MVNETEITIDKAIQLTGFSRHHLERLIKAHVVKAREENGVLVLDVASLESYSEKRAQRASRGKSEVEDNEETIVTNGAKYVSLNRAARLSGYAVQYIQQLTGEGNIQSKQFGQRTYVDIESLFSHRRAVHAQQSKWYDQASQKKERTEPAVVHRVSIYAKDDSPLFPVLTSKRASEIHHESFAPEPQMPERQTRVAVVEPPQKSTPSPFAVTTPQPAQKIIIKETPKTQAIQQEAPKQAQRKPVIVRRPRVSKLTTTLKIGTACVCLVTAYLGVIALTARLETAKAAFIVGKVLTLTEVTIPYYSR
jgi:hypothetical protein